MYGINTGIGELSEVALTDEQVGQFQRYLIYNHAAGIGEPFPERDRPRGDARSRQPARQGLLRLPGRDSRDLRGDAQRRRHAGRLREGQRRRLRRPGADEPDRAVPDGRGRVLLPGRAHADPRAMARAGIPVPGLQARDGLAAINGSNVITAIASLLLYDTERWIKQAEIAAAMSLEALQANMKPYTTKLHELRGFRGAVTSRRQPGPRDGRFGPADRQAQGQGPGCLLDALDAAGHRLAARLSWPTRASRSRSS